MSWRIALSHVNIYKFQHLIINLLSGVHKIFKKWIINFLEDHSLRLEVIHQYENEQVETIL